MRVLWYLIRLLLVGGLLLLEPLVGVMCSLAVVVGGIACVIFLASPAGEHFPLIKMLAVFGSFVVTAILYYGLIALKIRR